MEADRYPQYTIIQYNNVPTDPYTHHEQLKHPNPTASDVKHVFFSCQCQI